MDWNIIFCGTKMDPGTATNPLFPLSYTKQSRGNFWCSWNMMERHEERAILCSRFPSYISSWPYGMTNILSSTKEIDFVLSIDIVSTIATLMQRLWCCHLYYEPTFIHGQLHPFHHALPCKSTSFTGIGFHWINFCVAERRVSQCPPQQCV